MAKANRVDFNEEFHINVRNLANDTYDVLRHGKEQKYIKKLVKKGLWFDLMDFVAVAVELRPDFDNDDILSASERGMEGVYSLVVEACFTQSLRELADAWEQVMSTITVLPDLTWPQGFKPN